MSRSRLTFGVSLFVAMLAACASVADLDVKYQPEITNADDDGGGGGSDSGVDAEAPIKQRGNVRPSTAEIIDANQLPPPASTTLGTCAVNDVNDVGSDAGCDTAAGRGCCLEGNKGTCMEQRDLAECGKTGPARFIGCLRSSDDTACCWRAMGNVLVALPCSDGGVRACLSNSDCVNNETCNKVPAPCADNIEFGECGKGGGPALVCP